MKHTSIGGARRSRLFLVLTGALVCAAAAGSQEHGSGKGRDDHIKHGGGHMNEIGLVAGVAYEAEESDGYGFLGVEYERMFNERFGITAVAEYVPDLDAVVLIAPMIYRPDGPLRLAAGPGVELEPRKAESAEDSAGGRESRFLWRFGLGYSFRLGKGIVATPAFDIDLVRDGSSWETVLVLDVAIGFAF